jgi:hypothetical protein
MPLATVSPTPVARCTVERLMRVHAGQSPAEQGDSPLRCRLAPVHLGAFTDTPQLHGLELGDQIGSRLCQRLAETTIGLYKTKCIHDGSPFRHGPRTGLGHGPPVSATSRPSPRTGCTGATPADSCTASTTDTHPPMPRPTTMQNPQRPDPSHITGCIQPRAV